MNENSIEIELKDKELKKKDVNESLEKVILHGWGRVTVDIVNRKIHKIEQTKTIK